MLRWPDGLDAAAFLADYWQKRPCVLRRFVPGFTTPLSPDELAGLACEPDVESRIVIEDGATAWELRHGPFLPGDFAELGEQGWTLLVQDVDKHLPDLAGILDAFDFVPRWRIDDLMISFAPPGGSVGPHVDAYDVFLVQGLGRRRWHIDPAPASLATLDGPEIAILSDFRARESYDLAPGDALYLPPGVAHHGVALDACMTYSVGFRAPSRHELIESFASRIAAGIPESERYADPDLAPDEAEGSLIGPGALARARRALGPLGRSVGEEDLAEWFGATLTEPKAWLHPGTDARPSPGDVAERLAGGGGLVRHGMALLARARVGETAFVFACGAAWRLPSELWEVASALVEQPGLDAAALGSALDDPRVLSLLADLVAAGALVWNDDPELA